MRKWLFFAMVCVLVLGLSGPVQAQEAKKFSFWHIQNTGTGPEVIQKAVDRYMKDNPGVTVEVVPMQNDPYKTRIRTSMGAGDPPCVFPSWGGGPLYEYVKAGQVIDLTAMLNKDDYVKRFVPSSLSNITFDEKMWGVPVENTAIAVIYYNKDIFKKFNLTPPKTWDDLLKIVKTLKDNGVTPFSLANKTKWTSSMYYMYLVDRLAGPSVFAAAANRNGGTFEDPVFVKAGQMIQDLVKMGAFIEGFNGLDYDTGQSRMPVYADKAAMELMGTWQIATYKDENEEFYKNKLGFFPFPAVEGGKGDPTSVVGTVGDNYYHISSKCQFPEDAFKMITYLIDDESVKFRVETGRIPPVVGVSKMLEDPVLQEVIKLVEGAASVQLWYDQYLPPELGEVHKDAMQALFGLEITPEEAAKRHEDAAKKFFGK
jgi:raffinose/stachyose/melibiose transport system substrate-binding protein